MDVLREMLAIAVVFALLFAALRLLKKKNFLNFRTATSGPRLLESRAKLVLTAQHSLHWIRAGDRLFLIGVHPGGFTCLSEGPLP